MIFTKSMNRIAVLLEFPHFLVHTFREYGPSFMSKPANTKKMFPRIGTLTKPVNEVSA